MGQRIINKIRFTCWEYKLSFIATIIFGFLVHAYKILNTLPNHDSLYNTYSNQNAIASGRWLLSPACGITSYYDLPWTIGMVSLLILAITAAIIVSIFEIKDMGLILLVSAFTVAFPSITETFFFEFTADGYFVAMLLAVVAVKLTTISCFQKRKLFIASILISCTCGIYQSYISFAMILANCYFVWVLLTKDIQIKECWRWIVQQIVVYVGGLVLFYIIWKLLLFVEQTEVGTNQGVGEMSLGMGTILSAIPASIKSVLMFLVEWNVFEYGWTLYGILNVIFLVVFMIVLAYSIKKSGIYKETQKLLLVLAALAAIPFIACMWRFVTPSISYRPMMLGGLVSIYILAGVFAVQFFSKNACNVVGILLVSIVLNNMIVANISYYYMNQCYEKTYAMGTEIIQRIHMMDADTEEMPLVVIGDRSKEVSLDNTAHGKKIHMLGQLIESDLMFNEEHIVLFIKNVFDSAVHSADLEQRSQVIVADEIDSMGVWPRSDSVRIVENTIVIKISNNNGD